MKKLFTLVAMALMAVGANAQKVIAEIDWSTQEAFNNWCSGENGSTAVVGAEGLEINVPSAGENYWNPQTVVLNVEGEKVADNPDAPAFLEEDGQYKVVITAKHPAGHLQVNLGTWDDGVSLQKDFDVAEAADFEDIEIDFSEGWPADCFSNIHVLWQSGALPGLSVLKKIQVIDLNGGEGGEEGGEGEGGEGGSAIVGEIDWTQQEAFNNWCSGENGSTAVVGAEGLEINVPSAGENYWNPQTVVLNIEGEKVADNPDAPAILAEDGQYKVVIVAKHPAGHLQVNLGTWDDGVSLQKDFDVEEAADFHEIVVDFSEGWPADCFSNVHVLWQSGSLPGLSVLKSIQIIDLNATAIKTVKTGKKFEGAIYNLAGQKVNASYKGVVIKDGKKYIQK
ncbi:MAG: hypothetical protein IJ898_08595 [Prevotella sp.]|nr:hypothetical protein [Prevotella sp.]